MADDAHEILVRNLVLSRNAVGLERIAGIESIGRETAGKGMNEFDKFAVIVLVPILKLNPELKCRLGALHEFRFGNAERFQRAFKRRDGRLADPDPGDIGRLNQGNFDIRVCGRALLQTLVEKRSGNPADGPTADNSNICDRLTH